MFLIQELLIARVLVRSVMTLYDSAYFHYQRGGLDEEIRLSYEKRLLSILFYPGVSQFWKESRDLFCKSFQSYVDGLIRDHAQRSVGSEARDIPR